MNRSVLAGMLVATLVAVAPTGAFGQEPPDSVVEIEPILVRMLRSSVGAGQPSPVSIVSGPELTRATQGAFITDALRAVPGVQLDNRYNFSTGERISIRGFGARSQFGVRGIRLLVDGIPATLPDGQGTLDHLDLSQLGRVEALRGPSAALYGNAAGGVIHFRTADPATEPASLWVRTTSSGTDGPWPLRPNLWSLQAGAAGTSGDVGYRFGISRLSYDGFRPNLVAGDGSAYGAARRTNFNGTLSLPLGDGTLRLVMNGMDLFSENAGSINETVLASGEYPAHGFNVISGALKDVSQGQIGASWMGTLGGSDVEVATWGIRRDMYNPIPGTVIDLKRNAGGARALLQNTTDVSAGSLGVGVGIEVEVQSDDRRNRGNAGGSPTITTLDQQERVRGLGLFAQARLDLTAGVSLLGGIRYDRIAYSVDDRFFGFSDSDDSADRTMDAVSPSAGVVVSAGSSLEFFGSVSRSFETPTTTELANQPSGAGGFNPMLEPQLGLTFEGGVRSGLAGGWLVEGTVFRTKLTDGLVPFEVNNRTYYQNAAETEHVGWELSLDGQPARGVSTRLAVTHIDAEYQVFTTATDDYSGNKVPGLAPNRIEALLTLDRDLGYVELRGLFQDKVPVDDGGLFSADSYLVFDVRVGASELEMGDVFVAPFAGVANAFNASYVGSVVPNAFGGRYFEPSQARTYQIGVGVTWR